MLFLRNALVLVTTYILQLDLESTAFKATTIFNGNMREKRLREEGNTTTVLHLYI